MKTKNIFKFEGFGDKFSVNNVRKSLVFLIAVSVFICSNIGIVQSAEPDYFEPQPAGEHSGIVGNDDDILWDYELSDLINKYIGENASDFKFVFGQCFGGGMIDDINNINIISPMVASSGARHNEFGWGRRYSEVFYLKAWAEAAGNTSKNVSEICDDAKNNDYAGPNGLNWEHPQKLTKGAGAEYIKIGDGHAILFAGSLDGVWFWNELDRIYNVLKNKYGYTDDTIHVLYGDGSQKPGYPHVDGAGTQIALDNTLNDLSLEMSQSEQLFFWVSNHGIHMDSHGRIRRSDAKYTCNSCLNCTICLTGGDCDPFEHGVQVLIPGNTLTLAADIGRGNGDLSKPVGANCIDWNAAGNGVTFDCNFHDINGGNNMNNGIDLNPPGVWFAEIKNCADLRNFDSGILLQGGNFNDIWFNRIHANGNGISLINSDLNDITNNQIHDNVLDGISLINSNLNDITNNLAIDFNGVDGIGLSNSDNNQILRNTINKNKHNGVHIIDSELNKINENKINENDEDGVLLEDNSNMNEIKKNTITKNKHNGVHIILSEANEINENTVINENKEDGVFLDCSGSNEIKKNTINKNKHNGVFLVESRSNGINENTVNENDEDGVRLDASNDNEIKKNTINKNKHNGVHLWDSQSNEINENTGINENEGHGIYLLMLSNSNNMSDNPAINNNGVDGIKLNYSVDNIIESNKIDKNGRHGVHFFESISNIIDINTITDNGGFGVYDHPYPAGAVCGQAGVIPHTDTLTGNKITCDPPPASPVWQDIQHIDSDQWCLGGAQDQDVIPEFTPFGFALALLSVLVLVAMARRKKNKR